MASRTSFKVGQRSRKIYFAPGAIFPHRIFRQVDIDTARERERDHERRRHEEVGLDVLVHARLKISIAGEDRGRHQIEFTDRFLDLRMKRAGIADAGCAAVADDVKSELIEICLQPGFLQVIRDNARTGRQRSLHRWIDR